MPRLKTVAAALVVIAVAVPGCSRNRDVPVELAPSRMTTIGVNAYLWRASLDTLSFAPLLQADANTGVIITDWYSNPQSPTERVKVTASRQVNQGGTWVNATVSAATVQKLEDIILTRARDLRRSTVRG